MDPRLYFELHGEEMLRMRGMSKTEFAERMGVKKQNVNSLFQTKNIVTLKKAAEVLEMPLELLVSTPDAVEVEINGYLEVNGVMKKIKGKEDLMNIMAEINSHETLS